MSDQMFKPEYEGVRPTTVLTGPERQDLRAGKPDLVKRLHTAMLTMSVVDGSGPRGFVTGSVPAHIVEFADRVGEEKATPPKSKFEPTAAQVSDMDRALQLLEGLRPRYLKVVLLRALHGFSKECGEPGDWPWESIGGMFGLSESWAKSAYDAAIIQAARRSGLLPKTSTDHAVLAVAAWVDRGWLTNLSTAPDPRQSASNLRTKSPVKIDQAFAFWVAGPPAAKRVVDDARRSMRNLQSHGSWFKAHPDSVADVLVQCAQAAEIAWMFDELPIQGRVAA